MRKLKHILASLLCFTGCVPHSASDLPPPTTPPLPRQTPAENPKTVQRWAIYYDTQLAAEAFSDLDLVVFDGRYHPDIKALKGKTLTLAYVSMGEVHGDSKEKEIAKEDDAILYDNPNWDSSAIDLASKKWRQLVFAHVEKAQKDGFDGVMLDTVDSPLEWARRVSPERHKKMQAAAVRLIKDMHAKYPKMKIMLNRGFILWPEVASSIDYVLAESVLTKKDDSSGQFSFFPPNTYADAVAQLHQSVARAGHLQLFTLDYWDVDDVTGLERVYATQRASGFIPYVTSRDLRTYTPEPRHRAHLAAFLSSIGT